MSAQTHVSMSSVCAVYAQCLRTPTWATHTHAYVKYRLLEAPGAHHLFSVFVGSLVQHLLRGEEVEEKEEVVEEDENDAVTREVNRSLCFTYFTSCVRRGLLARLLY